MLGFVMPADASNNFTMRSMNWSDKPTTEPRRYSGFVGATIASSSVVIANCSWGCLPIASQGGQDCTSFQGGDQ